MMWRSTLIVIPLLLLAPTVLGQPSDVDGRERLSREISVSWDFGSGPGKTSNFYVGERRIEVRYDSQECLSRFTLEGARFELSQVEKNGTLVPEGPAFIELRFHKHFVGEFSLLPRVTITQNEANKKGRPTGRKMKVVFPFRERGMARRVADWSAGDIDVEIGAPGQIMDLHNPFDWFEIGIACD